MGWGSAAPSHPARAWLRISAAALTLLHSARLSHLSYQTVMQYQFQLMMKMQNELRSLQVKPLMSHKHNRCESELPCECSTALIEEMIAGASGSAGNAGHGSAAISSH